MAIDTEITAVTIRRYRKRRSTLAIPYDPWCPTAEDGNLVVDYLGKLYRLVESRGRQKRETGELSMREIAPPSPEMWARIIDGEIWWMKGDREEVAR